MTKSSATLPVVSSAAALAPPLLIAAAATAAIGVATGNRDLVRSGVRLAAVQLAASALRTAARRFDAAGTAAPPLIIDAVAGWIAEKAVAAALAKVDTPAAAKG